MRNKIKIIWYNICNMHNIPEHIYKMQQDNILLHLKLDELSKLFNELQFPNSKKRNDGGVTYLNDKHDINIEENLKD